MHAGNSALQLTNRRVLIGSGPDAGSVGRGEWCKRGDPCSSIAAVCGDPNIQQVPEAEPEPFRKHKHQRYAFNISKTVQAMNRV